jgi:hypothetical protein
MLLSEHPSETTDRPHRYFLRDLLTFDPKHDKVILGLTLIPFSFLWILDPWAHGPRGFSVIDGSHHNVIMQEVIFSGTPGQTIPYFAHHGYSLANVFPLYPLLLSIPICLSFGHPAVAIRLSLLLLSSIANLVFYSLCMTIRFVTHPFLSACLFTMYPFRSVLLRHIANEYSLFVMLLCGVLLGRQIHHKLLFSFSLFFLILTHELGIWIAIGLFGHPIMRRNRAEIRTVLVPFSAGLLFMTGFHRYYAGSFLAYFGEIVENRQFPFKEMISESQRITPLRHFHGNSGYFIIPFVACAMLVGMDGRIGVPLTIGLVWATAIQGEKMFNAAAPIDAVACLLGFDPLIRNARFQVSIVILAPLSVAAVIYLTWLILLNSHLYAT